MPDRKHAVPDESPTEAESLTDAVGHRTVDFASITRFGELTGDYSAMHFDARVGEAAGYGGPIAHGLLSACWAMGALTLHAPERVGNGMTSAIASRYSLRLQTVVRAGDHFSLAHSPLSAGPLAPRSESATELVTLNQNGETTSRAELHVRHAGDLTEFAPSPAPDPWDLERTPRVDSKEVFFAEDLVERGPAGRSPARTLTESDVTAFARHTGELNPLYLDAEFASRSVHGGLAGPPMLTFCLAFSDFLRALLAVPMPSAGFAGHLGDEWTLYEPIRIGDTLRTHHQPLGCVRSKSNPQRAIVRFGLQVVNQHGRVAQAGETVMLIPGRP